MAYVTTQIIKDNRDNDWLVSVTNDSGSGTMVIDTKIDRIILEVNSLIDTYLRDRYVLPLSTVPAIITGIAFDMAICHLELERFLPDVPEGLKAKDDKLTELLEDIRDGKNLLEATETDPSGSITVNDRTQKFTSDILDTM